MRIAYVCADFGIPILGYKGASVHVRELVNALTTEEHDVRVFSPNPGNGNTMGAPLRRVSADGLPDALRRFLRRRLPRTQPLDKEVRELVFNATLIRTLQTEFRHWGPDAIYERYSIFNLAGLALARRMGVPHLLEVNAPLRLERARASGLRLDGIARQVERRLFGSADRVLTVTAAMRRYVLSSGGRAERTLVLPNGVDVARFDAGRAMRETVRARLGLTPGDLVVGFAGSLKPWHGIETLVNAFGLLRERAPHVRLLIVGEGPTEGRLRARAAELGDPDSVIFTGRVNHVDMPGLLAAMDVGVAPYRDLPDFYFSPLKIYEYMASGLAVVASDAGDIGNLIHDGESGLLATPDDPVSLSAALARVVESPGLRQALGDAARAEVANHTWLGNARAVTSLAAASAAERRRIQPAPAGRLEVTSVRR